MGQIGRGTYRRAFAEYGTRALWNKRLLDAPTPEDEWPASAEITAAMLERYTKPPGPKPRKNNFTFGCLAPWRRHSCLPRPDSSGRLPDVHQSASSSGLPAAYRGPGPYAGPWP